MFNPRNATFLNGPSRVCSHPCRRGLRTSARLDQTASRLTPQEVSSIIRANEYTSEDISTTGNGPVKAFDFNSLRSNNPIEDSHNEAVVKPPGSGIKFTKVLKFFISEYSQMTSRKKEARGLLGKGLYSRACLKQDKTRLDDTFRIGETMTRLLVSGPIARENWG